MEKVQKSLTLAILVSETSHIFCCVLPTVFSVFSLLSGLGLVAAMPAWLQNFHDVMHRWEVPMIFASVLVLAMGWALYIYSKKVDCHDTGCGHGPCDTKKDTAGLILKIATLLLFVNITVYTVFHRGAVIDTPAVMHHGHSH
jgi:hypothetical protein